MSATLPDTESTRAAMIDACLRMDAAGLNQGTSGNISVRVPGGLLITPSAIPYRDMTPAAICRIPAEGEPGPEGRKPSTEWRFHQAVLAARPDCAVVLHAHPAHATAIAAQRRPIPAVHYMVAAFGGADVPVTGYALYGSAELAAMVAGALVHRHGCLLANHGAVVVGPTIDRALWRMEELETLARVLVIAETSGTPVLLSEDEIAEVVTAFADYGPR